MLEAIDELQAGAPRACPTGPSTSRTTTPEQYVTVLCRPTRSVTYCFVGIVWQQILDPSSGVVAQIARTTGLDWLAKGWLSDPDIAIFAVIFVNVWMWTGFSMLFYLAGLQLIDPSLIEAAHRRRHGHPDDGADHLPRCSSRRRCR